MTTLQEQAVHMIHGMSDDNVSFLIEVIHRLMPQNTHVERVQSLTNEKEKKMQAFKELDAARAQIKMYLPDDFDPDKELEDCLQDRCAEEAKADFIVTRNTADFAESKIPAIEPEEFLHKIC